MDTLIFIALSILRRGIGKIHVSKISEFEVFGLVFRKASTQMTLELANPYRFLSIYKRKKLCT